MSSCCSAPAPKEKKFGIKICRERNCEHLKNTSGYGGAQERCHALGGNNSIMPGTLPCCIQDPAMAPETFLRQVSYSLSLDWEKSNPNIQRPGPKNCPATCPYKISEQGEVFGKTGAGRYEKKQGTIWKCAFSGGILGQGLGGSCLCHVLGNPEQEAQINVLKCVIRAGFANNTCWYGTCPDGVERCTVEDEICPVINLPRMQHGCPLWRIPAKLLPKTDPIVPEKPVSSIAKAGQKYKEITLSQGKIALVDSDDYERLNQFKWSARKRNPGSSVYYAVRTTPERATIRMHREIMNPPEWMEIDHINGNGLDNCKENLKVVTTRQNLQNRHDNKSSSYPGVNLIPSRKKNKWQARIWDGEREIFLGNFPNEELAASAYREALLSFEKGEKLIRKTERNAKKPKYRQATLDDFAKSAPASIAFMERVAETARQRRTAQVKDEPEPYVQHCCGTCGHHKGRKTFHESCPRLGEMLFKGGTKSAKVLMEETAVTPCEHWIKKNACAACDNPCGNQFMPGKPCRNELAHVKTPAKKLVPDSHEDRVANIQAAQRKAHPSWKWEVWQIDKEKGDWLWEVCPTEAAAKNLKKNLEKNVGDPRKWEVRERKDEKTGLKKKSKKECETL